MVEESAMKIYCKMTQIQKYPGYQLFHFYNCELVHGYVSFEFRPSYLKGLKGKWFVNAHYANHWGKTVTNKYYNHEFSTLRAAKVWFNRSLAQ